jgi:hypothetical protein
VTSGIVEGDTLQDKLQVVVDEKHSDAANYPLHLQLDPPPDSLRHTFFEDDLSARHTFSYSVQGEHPKLLVLTRDQIEAAGAAVVLKQVEVR